MYHPSLKCLHLYSDLSRFLATDLPPNVFYGLTSTLLILFVKIAYIPTPATWSISYFESNSITSQLQAMPIFALSALMHLYVTAIISICLSIDCYLPLQRCQFQLHTVFKQPHLRNHDSDAISVCFLVKLLYFPQFTVLLKKLICGKSNFFYRRWCICWLINASETVWEQIDMFQVLTILTGTCI